jgi:hypothetical protein
LTYKLEIHLDTSQNESHISRREHLFPVLLMCDVKVCSKVAYPIASASFCKSHILYIVNVAFDRPLATSFSSTLYCWTYPIDVERKICDGLLPDSTYHCVLFTPYDSLTLQSDSALPCEKSFASSNEGPPISCQLL